MRILTPFAVETANDRLIFGLRSRDFAIVTRDRIEVARVYSDSARSAHLTDLQARELADQIVALLNAHRCPSVSICG